MKYSAALAAALLLAAPHIATAQTASASPELQAAAERYVNLPAVRGMMDQLLSGPSLASMATANLPAAINLSDAQMARIGAILSDEIKPFEPQIRQAMISSAVRNFTADELGALIDFYLSEHGASVMTKMQPFMQDAMGQIAPVMSQVQRKAIPRILGELQRQ